MSEAKEIAAKITKAMEGVTDGPWKVYEGCSWRRIGTVGRDYNDCDVLAPTVASDGHPDLTCHRGNDLQANLDYIVACNPANMRVILEALAMLPSEPVAWQWRQSYGSIWGNWNDCGLLATDQQKWIDLAKKLPNEVQVRPLYTSPTPHPSLDREGLLEEARAVIEQVATLGRLPDARTRSKWIVIPASVFSAAQALLSKLEASSK